MYLLRRDARELMTPSRRWWMVAVILLLVAAWSTAVGLDSDRDSRAASPAATGRPATAPSGMAHEVVARSTPVAIRIPAIGVAARVSALGLDPDATVQVPANFQEPGWFRPGPSPGQVGSAVILGHVDSYRGPAVFYRLRELRAGDQVEVSLADGVVVHFVVNSVATYPKDQFPAGQVYGSRGYSALQLVTCGGTFDTHTRSYRSNVVVYTSLVEVTPTTSAAA